MQFSLDHVPAMFEKPEDRERKHLRPLLHKGYINGKPITKMLVDGGARVNLRSEERRVGKGVLTGV